jgi:hypothetical protein
MGTVLGGAGIAVGSSAGAAKVMKHWTSAVSKKRADCTTARQAFLDAKQSAMKNGLAKCWPQPFAAIDGP